MNSLLCAQPELLPGEGPTEGHSALSFKTRTASNSFTLEHGDTRGRGQGKGTPGANARPAEPTCRSSGRVRAVQEIPGISVHLGCSDKTPQTECLINNGNHCSQLRGWKSQVMVLGESVSDENHGS